MRVLTALLASGLAVLAGPVAAALASTVSSNTASLPLRALHAEVLMSQGSTGHGRGDQECKVNLPHPFMDWCSAPQPNNCPVQEGIQDLVCSIANPDGSTTDMCYRPGEHVCTPQKQLCPVSAPYSCGQACYPASEYSCDSDPTNIFDSQLQQRGNYDTTDTCFVYSPLQHFFPHNSYQAVATSYSPLTQDCVASCHIPLPFPTTLPLEANWIVKKGLAACGTQAYNPLTQQCVANTAIEDPFCAFAKIVNI